MSLRLLAGYLLAGCLLVAGVAQGKTLVCADEFSDSIKITDLLKGVDTLAANQSKILFLAKGFQGTPYQGGTLETFPFERLVVRTDSVDCTTFVEYVLAMYLTDQQRKQVNEGEKQLYAQFKKNLQTIRYRGGELHGYTSRLHYFSEWILDNERKGIVQEVTKSSPYAVRKFDLNFMSTHASLYPMLANADNLSAMKTIERGWYGYQMAYIPKEKLSAGKEVLDIRDGDILTLATNISGLDVVHVGFACWLDGQLHLLHASSARKRVLLDPHTLYTYSKTNKSHLGIRVIRVL